MSTHEKSRREKANSCRTIDVDLCPRCETIWKKHVSVFVAHCAECGRGACTCLLEQNSYEDESEKRYFCMPGAKGGCTKEEEQES